MSRIWAAAESLLEQVDKRGAELSQEVRSGSRAVRQATSQLERKLELLEQQQHQQQPHVMMDFTSFAGDAGSVMSSAAASPAPPPGVVDAAAVSSNSDLANTMLAELKQDLKACHEALASSQLIAADREAALSRQMDKLREEQEIRETELMTRIRQLESEKQTVTSPEQDLHDLLDEVERLREEKNGDELQLQAETARREAEHFAKALQASERDFSQRTLQLEQANLALLAQLAELQQQQQSQSNKSRVHDAEQEEAEEDEEEVRRMQKRLVQLEDAKANLEQTLAHERRLGNETASHKAELVGKARVLEERVQQLQRELDTASAASASAAAATTTASSGDNSQIRTLETRLEALSKHVEIKQRQIDVLRSEKAGLVNQLSMVHATNTTGGQLHHRGGASATPLTAPYPSTTRPVPRLKIRHKEIGRAVDVVDGLALSLGHVMRGSPVLRLAFLGYLCVLHLWVLHVVNWSSTSSSSAASPALEVAAGALPGGGLTMEDGIPVPPAPSYLRGGGGGGEPVD